MESFILDEEMFAPSQTAAKKNKVMICSEYFKLKLNIAQNLKKANIDMSTFHGYIQELCDDETIVEADSVSKVFTTLTKKKYWNFMDISGLESVVEMFSEHLEKENMDLLRNYKAQLAGFKAATKIKDYIACDKENASETPEHVTSQEHTSIADNKGKYDEKYRTELSVKLLGNKNATINISLESLMYIERLWTSLREEFKMPPLPHLLDKIVTGCIVIHWIVHHDVVHKILEGIGNAREYFEREGVANIHLQEICVYDQDTGVVNQKVC